MFGKPMIAALALLSLGTAQLPTAPGQPNIRKIGPEQAQAEALVAGCNGKDGWADPAPPVRIATDVYYVGTCGITALLITSPAGHVLIDSGPREAAPLVLANIRRLGHEPRKIKWLLASHAHFDHVGGLRRIQQLTGARVAALPDQARELAMGTPAVDDPQHGAIKPFDPVKVSRILTEKTPIVVGQNRIDAVATPGHTRGSTSWLIRACDKQSCSFVEYLDSVSAVSADSYRFSDHPAWVTMFRSGLQRMGTLPCNILVTPHPSSSSLFERLTRKPGSSDRVRLYDDGACSAYVERGWRGLDDRLTREAGIQ